jgi:hypothetical protein
MCIQVLEGSEQLSEGPGEASWRRFHLNWILKAEYELVKDGQAKKSDCRH